MHLTPAKWALSRKTNIVAKMSKLRFCDLWSISLERSHMNQKYMKY
jgi:hypothetical protein